MGCTIRGSYHGRSKDLFFVFTTSRPVLDPTIFLFSRYRGYFPNVIVPVYEVYTSSLSGAEVRNS
jgi:hypothetical protein